MSNNNFLNSKIHKRNDAFEQLKKKYIELQCGSYKNNVELKYLDHESPAYLEDKKNKERIKQLNNNKNNNNNNEILPPLIPISQDDEENGSIQLPLIENDIEVLQPLLEEDDEKELLPLIEIDEEDDEYTLPFEINLEDTDGVNISSLIHNKKSISKRNLDLNEIDVEKDNLDFIYFMYGGMLDLDLLPTSSTDKYMSFNSYTHYYFNKEDSKKTVDLTEKYILESNVYLDQCLDYQKEMSEEKQKQNMSKVQELYEQMIFEDRDCREILPPLFINLISDDCNKNNFGSCYYLSKCSKDTLSKNDHVLVPGLQEKYEEYKKYEEEMNEKLKNASTTSDNSLVVNNKIDDNNASVNNNNILSSVDNSINNNIQNDSINKSNQINDNNNNNNNNNNAIVNKSNNSVNSNGNGNSIVKNNNPTNVSQNNNSINNNNNNPTNNESSNNNNINNDENTNGSNYYIDIANDITNTNSTNNNNNNNNNIQLNNSSRNEIINENNENSNLNNSMNISNQQSNTLKESNKSLVPLVSIAVLMVLAAAFTVFFIIKRTKTKKEKNNQIISNNDKQSIENYDIVIDLVKKEQHYYD